MPLDTPASFASMSDPAVMSASAKKRARQKANAAAKAAEEAASAPEPEPAPKSKAKAKAQPKEAAPAPAPEPKAKAKGKAKEPEAPAPKADAKAKAKAAAPAPKQAAAPEPKASAKGKAKAKAKAKAEEEVEEKQEKSGGRLFYQEIDDGSRAGEWETATGLDKKRAKQKERAEEKKAEQEAAKKAGVITAKANQHIPGLAPVDVQVAQAKQTAKAKAKAAVSQAVTAVAVVSAATVAAKEKEPEKAAAPVDNSVSASVKIPEKKIGVLVGPGGANIKMIKEKTGVKNVDISGDMCTIVGLPDQVTLAEAAVHQLIEKGYMALSYDDFAEEDVMVLPIEFPNIIGQKGAIIQEIKKAAKVEISIPAVPKNPPQGKKYKVNIAGSKEGVQLGKEVINSIVTYGHHEVTHPGQIHKEMEIEEWRYRFLIGSKGSEMRHIQNNFNVKVNIPREHSVCKNVVIVGEPRDVDRAIKYIEKIMYEADQPRGRGAPEKATDDGGDDGEIEDWMRPYMYQRK